MRKRKLIWTIFIGALFLALSCDVCIAQSQSAGHDGCYLSAHGDIQCPNDPEHPGPLPPGGIGAPPWVTAPLPGSPPILGIGSCGHQNPLDVFREHARAREGYSTKVYLDSLGNPTVGIGHLVAPGDDLEVGDEISPERVQELWLKDSMASFTAAMDQAKGAGICDSCFIAALASVDYQLGTNWRAKFPVVWALIVAGRYDEAADRLETSAWNAQTPVRVRDFQMVLRALPPKPPACVPNPPIVLPPKLCDIVPEMCEPMCYGDLCHCKMEPIPGGGPAPAAAPAETDAALPAAVPAASVAPAAASTAQCYDPTSCQADVTPGNFMSELNSKGCGCTLKLAPGNYPSFNYTKKCTSDHPFILEAKNMGGPSFGGFTVNGDGLIVNGINVNSQITINGDYNRITRTLFVGNGQVDFIEGSAFNRIDHNDLILPVSASGETNAAIAFYRPRSTAQMYNNNRIDSNYFTTNSGPSSATEGSAIFHCMYGAQDGYQYLSRFGSSRTLIENNLFEDWGRKNVMEVKCSDNVFRNNTLINSGRVLSRHGYHNQYLNNYMQNLTTGLAIREYQQQVIGNYLDRARIILYGGTRKYPDGNCYQARAWMPPGYPGAPQGPPAVGTFLDKNRGPLSIGETEGAGCNVPVLNTTIACHEGPITKTNYDGLTGPSSTNCGFTMPHKLTRAEVGRGGPEGSCEVPVVPGLPVCEPGGGDPLPPPPGPICSTNKACTSTVTTADALRNAMGGAKCGDVICVGGGSYNGTFNLNTQCTAANPVVVHAVEDESPNISGRIILKTKYAIIEGLNVNGDIEVTGSYNRITRNFVQNSHQSGAIRFINGSYNSADRNEVTGFAARGIEVQITGDAGNVIGNRVEYNYIHDPSGSGNGHEGIRILTGSGAPDQLNSVFSHNLLERVNIDPEAISIKANGNTVENNTLLNCGDGRLSNRFGTNNIFRNNYTIGSYGIGIFDEHNTVENNTIVNGRISLRAGWTSVAGTEPAVLAKIDKSKGHYPAASNNTIKCNAVDRIEIGAKFSGVPHDRPASDNVLTGNTPGTPVKIYEQNTMITGGSCNTPVGPLTKADVGRDAPDPGCAAP